MRIKIILEIDIPKEEVEEVETIKKEMIEMFLSEFEGLNPTIEIEVV